MGAIRFTQFGGLNKSIAPRLIPDLAAQSAVNCSLETGELVPVRMPKKVGTVGAINPSTLYRAYDAGDFAWLAFTSDTDIVKAPLRGSGKWCLSDNTGARMASLASIGAGQYYQLGTPAPQSAPTVLVSGGSGSQVTRYYAYTFVIEWEGVQFEGAISPLSEPVTGNVNGTWTISDMDSQPISGGGASGVYASGYTTFTTPDKHWLRTGEYVVIGNDNVQVTVLSDTQFKVNGDYSSYTSWSRLYPFPGNISKRIYRSAGTTGQFQLVAEGITGTSFTDTLTDAQIPGDELISAGWDMPPVGITGLCVLPSGALAGFVRNTIYFSEPYQPHAWPAKYAINADNVVIGIAPIGTGAVVATEAKPMIISGIEPGQMYAQYWDEALPCVSKQSIVSTGDGALYASNVGLVYSSISSTSIFSAPLISREEWAALNPMSMRSAMAGKRLYVMYNNAERSRIMCFDMNNGVLTETDVSASTIYADDNDGKLYFAYDDDVYELDPLDGNPLTQEWMSKDIQLPAPSNLGAAKVVFDSAISNELRNSILAEKSAIETYNNTLLSSGEINGAFNKKTYNSMRYNGSALKPIPDIPPANEVLFRLYTVDDLGEKKLIFEKNVTNSSPFNLPSGMKYEVVSFSVRSQCRIHSVEIGSTRLSLKQA